VLFAGNGGAFGEPATAGGGSPGGGGGVGAGGAGAGGGAGGFGAGGGGGSGYAGASGGFGGGAGGGGDASTGDVPGFGGGVATTNPSDGGGGAGMGGVIFNMQGSVTVSNSTLYGNTAAGGSGNAGGTSNGQGLGGAIFNLNGSASVNGVTINQNTADGGGGIYDLAYDSATARTVSLGMVNSIVYGNTGNDLVSYSPPSTTAGTNLSSDTVGVGGQNDVGSANFPVSSFITGDPRLGVPANNGGPGMLTEAPGRNSAAAGAGSGCLATDEAGDPRPTNGCDLGALEVTGVATHLEVIPASSSVQAGTARNVNVAALDAFGGAATTYSGTVHLTSSDAGFVNQSGDIAMLGGVGYAQVVLRTLGQQTITATDVNNPAISGTSPPIDVTPGPAVKFTLSSPSSATAGQSFTFSLSAEDAYGNTATGYLGTVHFTSSDPHASLPADATLSNGSGTFSATLRTAGNQTLTATDTTTSSVTATSGPIAVAAARVTHFAVAAPSSATAGHAFNLTVTALDQFDNTATGYAGKVHFTSTDGAATLPADATLTNGVGSFGATLKTAGKQTITAADAAAGAITGTSGSIAVSAAAADHFTLSAPASATAGTPISFKVSAFDPYGNQATGYAGTVHFSSTDSAATLPADASLSGGSATFSATFNTAGNQTITATDKLNPALSATSAAVAVAAKAGSGPPPPPAAPQATVAPTISGTPAVGQVLTCNQGSWSGNPSSFAFQWLRNGTPIQGATASTYTVTVADYGTDLSCVVTATATGPGGSASGSQAAVPAATLCPVATGSLRGGQLGLVHFGLTRGQAQVIYPISSTRGRRYVDFFCLSPVGIRVGFASARLASRWPRSLRARYADRIVWISSSDSRYEIDGIAPEARLKAAERRLRGGRLLAVGRNEWYFAPVSSQVTALLKVRHGEVQEVGVAPSALTRTSALRWAFITSFG
jgi:hypothetical protein